MSGNPPPTDNGHASAPAPPLFGHVWIVLSAPRTLVAVASMIAICLLWASTLPQGASFKELLSTHSFGVSRVIVGLGLNHVASSWLVHLLSILLVLNMLGIWLRARKLSAGDVDSVVTPSFVFEHVPQGIDEVERLLSRRWGSRANVEADGPGRVRYVFGMWSSAIITIAVGVCILLISWVVSAFATTEMRVTLNPDPSGANLIQGPTEQREEGRWIETQHHTRVTCLPANPADPMRRRKCQTQGSDETFTIGVNHSHLQGKHTWSALTEWPVSGLAFGTNAILIQRDESEAPHLFKGEHGKTYALESGDQITSFSGPDGPLVIWQSVITPTTSLYTPATGHGKTPLKSDPDLRLSGLWHWAVALDVSRYPHQVLLWLGVLLLVIGLLMLLSPHIDVRLSSDPSGGTHVATRSRNKVLVSDWYATHFEEAVDE